MDENRGTRNVPKVGWILLEGGKKSNSVGGTRVRPVRSPTGSRLAVTSFHCGKGKGVGSYQGGNVPAGGWFRFRPLRFDQNSAATGAASAGPRGRAARRFAGKQLPPKPQDLLARLLQVARILDDQVGTGAFLLDRGLRMLSCGKLRSAPAAL